MSRVFEREGERTGKMFLRKQRKCYPDIKTTQRGKTKDKQRYGKGESKIILEKMNDVK